MTGPIPDEELEVFVREAARMEQQAVLKSLRAGFEEGKDGDLKKTLGAGVKGRRRHWYTRHYMWEMAQKVRRMPRYEARGELRTVTEMENDEYNDCLERVDDYLRKHKSLRDVNRVGRDMGPRGAQERDWPGFAESEAHNGEGGGRVFKWYSPAVFALELQRRGVDRVTCTEKQCVDALRRRL